MKGLWKYISPFAPDQSGAAAVLYELGGLIIICDAGGCAGNVCGFDEPRWFKKKSAIFSAGLRDMDAILGRDDKLIEKLCMVSQQIKANFAAIIGTPVPSVIGTDYHALKRMAEKQLDLPIMTIDTTGMALYDAGAEKAYVEAFRLFAKDTSKRNDHAMGIIGSIPLDTGALTVSDMLSCFPKNRMDKIIIYGQSGGIESFQNAGSVEKNLVISPSGIKAAHYLKERFGTPYEITYPFLPCHITDMLKTLAAHHVLIVHQQVYANTVRQFIQSHQDIPCTVASWFMLADECCQSGDIQLQEEDDFVSLVKSGQFDCIIADGILRKAIPDYDGLFIDTPHFAVSGRI